MFEDCIFFNIFTVVCISKPFGQTQLV